MDINATTLALLAAASVLVGIAYLRLMRRQPGSLFLPARQRAKYHGDGPGHDASEPDIRVLFGEFFQVRTGGDETDKAIRYEATANFRLLIANRGLGRAMSIRAHVTCEGMAKPSWATSGGVDLAPEGEQDIILRSAVLPPLGPEEVRGVEVPLRIEYRDSVGIDWYTLTRLRLKFMKSEATGSYACWWVDVLEPQEHGGVEQAVQPVKKPVQAMPVAAATAAPPSIVSREPVPFPSRDRGHDRAALPVPVAASTSSQRSRPGDAAAAAGLR